MENLLDYAVLKALAEKLLVASVDRRGDQVAIKFYDDTPLGPERIVKLIRKRSEMRLDPTGVLWLDWKSDTRAGRWAPPETYCYNYNRRDKILGE